MSEGDTIKSIWKKAPDSSLSNELQSIIDRWNDDPSAIQVLELLDWAIHSGGANQFTVRVLETMLYARIKEEHTTYADVIARATWRKEMT